MRGATREQKEEFAALVSEEGMTATDAYMRVFPDYVAGMKAPAIRLAASRFQKDSAVVESREQREQKMAAAATPTLMVALALMRKKLDAALLEWNATHEKLWDDVQDQAAASGRKPVEVLMDMVTTLMESGKKTGLTNMDVKNFSETLQSAALGGRQPLIQVAVISQNGEQLQSRKMVSLPERGEFRFMSTDDGAGKTVHLESFEAGRDMERAIAQARPSNCHAPGCTTGGCWYRDNFGDTEIPPIPPLGQEEAKNGDN